MKQVIYFVLVLMLLFIVSGAFLSLMSRKQGQPKGLVGGSLAPCPERPNCVCSEYLNQPGYVEPLEFSVSPSVAWKQVQLAIKETGGKITLVEDHYLRATFSSKLFGFIDDVELRLDDKVDVIHVRSASRVGYSDLGVNLRRIEHIRDIFSELVSGGG